jgi:hypothetical protein
VPKDKGSQRVEIPSDLSTLSDEELQSLHEQATTEFDALDADENTDATGLSRMSELADAIEMMGGEFTARETAAAEQAAQREQLRGRVHPEEPDDAVDGDGGDGVAEGEGVEAPAGEPALVAGARGRTDVRDVLKSRNKLNIRLAEASRHQSEAATRGVPLFTSFGQSVLVASADIPGMGGVGAPLADMNALVSAYKTRARALPVSRAVGGNPVMGTYLDVRNGQAVERFGLLGNDGDWRQAPRFPVASMQREFRYNLDDTSSPNDAWEVMQAAAAPESLVAAGGWCSPSEIRYDFYNVVAMDGAYDLPTTGIRRGGLRWPTSPSYGDLVAQTPSPFWHWTETQDIAAATGTAQSGTKTCGRVPCAAFNEVRLEGEGICVTAGNLTTDAWPEQIANYLRLVNAVHFHRVNSFFINSVIAGSTAVTLTQTLGSPTTDVLAGVEHQVWDLRTKYAMADTDVLEVVFPSWILGLIRADISRRTGLDTPDSAFSVTNAMIASWFSERYVSVQFIQDFDVRGAAQFGQSAALATAWPTTVRFLIYPAGTWLRGNGLNLDLGIIRDSTLNATNDYTAAWSEEFFALAKIGHESRIVTLGASANTPTGTTGALTTATGI